MWYFWWGCRGSLKSITLGSWRVKRMASLIVSLNLPLPPPLPPSHLSTVATERAQRLLVFCVNLTLRLVHLFSPAHQGLDFSDLHAMRQKNAKVSARDTKNLVFFSRCRVSFDMYRAFKLCLGPSPHQCCLPLWCPPPTPLHPPHHPHLPALLYCIAPINPTPHPLNK